MERCNYSNARAQLYLLMDKAISCCHTEIICREKESAVLISKASYKDLKKAEFEKKFKKDLKLTESEH